MRHNCGRGGVSSPCTPTASGMELQQCPGWRHDGEGGCTGPIAAEGMRLTGPTSRCGPVRARNRRPSPLRGFRRPLSRVRRAGCTRVGGTVSRS
jgi:hypothetical protein